MSAGRTRHAIAQPDLADIGGMRILHDVGAICGVRIFDVGQGDAVAILGVVDNVEKSVLLLDYGGREGNPFDPNTLVDRHMPVVEGQLLMLSHWDEDHWCAAKKGMQASHAKWLVPRQLTSPRAVRFSSQLDNIHCVPERLVGSPRRFRASNDDAVWWEKIGAFPGVFAKDEDCNRTGVALAVVARPPNSPGEAILLAGDAPFDKVGIFRQLRQSGVRLRGLVAFHHGAGTHWTRATGELIRNWPSIGQVDVVFSCSETNSYGHPDEDRYRDLLPYATFRRTATARGTNAPWIDLRF